MIRFLYVLLIASCLLVAACERPAAITAPLLFREGGITFEYPSNWRVTENSEVDVGRLIHVEEPGSALVVLTIYSEANGATLEEYAEMLSSNLSDSLPFGLIKSQGVAERSASLDMRFSIGALGESIPHTANITLHKLGARTAICLTQVADEDRKYVQPGFDLLRRTLKSVE